MLKCKLRIGHSSVNPSASHTISEQQYYDKWTGTV